jgi:hypothetical protein
MWTRTLCALAVLLATLTISGCTYYVPPFTEGHSSGSDVYPTP